MADHKASPKQRVRRVSGRSQARAGAGESSSSSSSASSLLPSAIKTRSFIHKLHYGGVDFFLVFGFFSTDDF